MLWGLNDLEARGKPQVLPLRSGRANRSLWKRRSPLCHPERTGISCYAAPDTVACAPFLGKGA